MAASLRSIRTSAMILNSAPGYGIMQETRLAREVRMPVQSQLLHLFVGTVVCEVTAVPLSLTLFLLTLYTTPELVMATDITGMRRVVISDLARPAYDRLPRDRQAEIRRRARALAEGKEQAEQDFGGGILRFLLRDDTQVYIEVSRDEIIVRHIV